MQEKPLLIFAIEIDIFYRTNEQTKEIKRI